MKKIILIVIIYLTGCVYAYKYTKFNLQQDGINKEWTKGDRKYALLLSVFSWAAVAANGIIDVVLNINNDEKAEW